MESNVKGIGVNQSGDYKKLFIHLDLRPRNEALVYSY